MALPRNSAPSQVAHAETPWFVSRSSLSRPSQRAEAPVDTITASAVNFASAVSTTNGRLEKSTRVASS